MTCREADALLTDVLDGRLDAAGQVRLHAHLEECATCRARAALWTQLTPSMRAAAPPAPDEMQTRRLEVAVERARVGAAGAAPAVARRRFAWVAPAALAAAAIVLIVARRHGSAALTVEVGSVRGATVVTGDARALPLERGVKLGAEQTLVLAADGSAELALGPGTTLGLHGPARLALRGSAAAVELALAEGVLDAVVAHRRPGETFVVSARGARVIVRGTRFTVAASPEGSISAAGGGWVRVDEGRVGVVDASGVERSVSSGETLSLAAPTPVGPRPLHDAPTPIAREPEAAAGACPSARACASLARQARLAMRAGGYKRALSILSSAPASGESDACRATHASCQRELGYLEAEALRLDGRLDAAVDAYKRLDQRGAPSATRQNALYAAAQLEQRLGRAPLALADYQRALAAAPAGALHAEALLGAMESAAEAHEPAQARALARRYLDQAPDGPGASRARLLVGGSAGRGPLP